MIYNVFNKDLLIKYKALQFKGQYIDPAFPPTIINEEKKYKSKKYRSIENEEKRYNTYYTGRAMEISIINRLQKQDYLMQKRQLKTIKDFKLKPINKGVKSHSDNPQHHSISKQCLHK